MYDGRYAHPAYMVAPSAADEYDERDLADLMRSAAATPHRHFSYPAAAPPQPPHPPPPRSSWSSPPPVLPRPHSLEVGSVYSAGSAPAAAWSPAQNDYGLYASPHSAALGSPHHHLGATPPAGDYPHGGYDDGEVPTNEHYWYAAPPPGSAPSLASSNTFADRAAAHRLYRPSSLPGAGFGAPGDDDVRSPSLFGVDAPHHVPGHRRGLGPASAAAAADALPAFPTWSRTWYDGHLSANGHAYTTLPPMGSGASGWESADTLTRSGVGGGGPPHPVYGYGRAYDPRMSDVVKQERIRMLEKEFGVPRVAGKNGADAGGGGKGGGGGDDDDDEEDEEEEEELVAGNVDRRGHIVSSAPRIRLALRVFQGLAALSAFACGIGGALLVKPPARDPAAAQGQLPAYVLYGVSVVTLLVVAYLFVLRPCCCDPARKLSKQHAMGGGGGDGGPLSGLVIPVLSGGNANGKAGKAKRGGAFSRKKGGGMPGAMPAPTVNLIVDPTLLGGGKGGRRGDDEEDEDEDEDDGRLPGAARRRKRGRRGGRELGVLGNMQLQQRWHLARRGLKLLTVWDALLLVGWLGTAGVALGVGQSCKPGTGGGWCDWYNAAIASGCLLAADLAALLFLDWRDLRCSRRPPRPRI